MPPLLILVGEGRSLQAFTFDKTVICAYSDFFKAACNPDSEEGKTNTVKIPKANPDSMAIFLTWLTTEDIEDAEILAPKRQQPRHFYRKDNRVIQLVECYALGDFLQATGFQNSIMDSLLSYWQPHLRGHNAYVSVDLAAFIYEKTRAGSPPRRLVVDCASNSFFEREYNIVPDRSQSCYPDEFCEDAKGPYREDPCSYHVHPGKPYGYSCTKTQNILV